MNNQGYNDYGCSQEQDEFLDRTFSGPRSSNNYYDIGPYYADEIGNSSPSPPEKNQYFEYEPEDINEYERDDVPYYEDDPIHCSSAEDLNPVDYGDNGPPFTASLHNGPFGTQPESVCFQTVPFNFRTSPLHHPQLQRQPTYYQPNEKQEHNFRAPRLSSSPHRGSNPRNFAGIRLHPVSDLPDFYRGLFKFGVFNAVQSTCFSTVIESNENMVISAPTGSGKTVLFELAIIRMLRQAKESGKSPKCVYMAPTKALCSERQKDWTSKFSALGFKCCELTGDTVMMGKGAWGEAKTATIIITTGEKWDSLTRNWADQSRTLSQIQLFLVDEVHILNEPRGSTLEVVVSRMKSHGSAVRFVLVSATVPNIHDIASWIGNERRDSAARVFEFGEEFRPCKLTRHVIGVTRQRNENDFSFTRKLDFRLFSALQTHSVGKPILVFVSTRKGVLMTADQLMKEYSEAEKDKKHLPWTHPKRIEHVFHERRLIELASFGIGIHHAGLTIDDRRAVEDLYLKGALRVVVATSTLAVGVNLPAHTVVIKGVQTYQNNAFVEYSDLDVMQMLGRAGRPQFDKDGIAIILCETDLETKYRELVRGRTIVESSLHTNLSEHINSEIGLGTITSIRSAKDWLRGSYLFQRIKKNPAHYSLGKSENQSWEERVDDMVMQSVENLRETKLIAGAKTGDTSGALMSTEFGDIMSKFYIRQSTMSLILALPERPTLREILEMISASEELSEVKLRTSEKTVFNKLRKHNDIRFEVKKVEKTSDKVFLLIQAVLGGVSLNAPEYKSSDSQLNLEAFSVFKHISRIARAVVEAAIVKKRGAQLKYGLELVRCLTAKAWEDRPVVLKQLESIGEKSIKVLAENGITSFALLAKQEPYRIEMLLNRRPPFGLEILASVNELPQYTLAIKEAEVRSNGGEDPVEIDLSIACGLAINTTNVTKAKKQKGRTEMTAILTLSSDLELVDFRRTPTKALREGKTFEITVELTKPSQSVLVMITSETIAGVTVTQTYKPQVSYKEYPTRDTRPPTVTDLHLEGMEDSDFWSLHADDNGNEILASPALVKDSVVRDLTKPRVKISQPSQIPDAPKVADDSPAKPKKLPNGNYECNHSCKDKTQCRHLCCRDGLPAPLKQLKKRTALPNSNNARPPGTLPSQHQRSNKHQKLPDPTIQQLEKLHERTNVSLKLPQGSRIKLEPTGELKHKRKPIIDFSVDLTQLNDGKPGTSYAVPDLKDDDDLPEPLELLIAAHSHTKAHSSPQSNYSVSDIDSLIRQVPSELMQDATKTAVTSPKSTLRRDAKIERRNALPSTPLPPRKRHHSSEEDLLPPKRSRVDAELSQDFSSSPVGRGGCTKTGTSQSFGRSDRLFGKHSEARVLHYSDLEARFSDGAEAGDFIPDYETLPSTPALTASDDDLKATSDLTQPVHTPDPKPRMTHLDEGEGKDFVMHDVNGDDDLREFDAWLNSGAVE